MERSIKPCSATLGAEAAEDVCDDMFGGQQSNGYGACLEPQALSIATLRGGPADPLPAYWLALPSFFPCRVHA